MYLYPLIPVIVRVGVRYLSSPEVNHLDPIIELFLRNDKVQILKIVEIKGSGISETGGGKGQQVNKPHCPCQQLKLNCVTYCWRVGWELHVERVRCSLDYVCWQGTGLDIVKQGSWGGRDLSGMLVDYLVEQLLVTLGGGSWV